MTLKNAIASCLVIALGIILVAHFVLFWIYGGVFIYESNKIVLSVETVLSIGIFAFGIERLLNTAGTGAKRKVSGILREEYTRSISSSMRHQPQEAAAVFTATIETIMPGITAVLAESVSDNTEVCVMAPVKSIQTLSDIFIATPNICGEHTVVI